MIKVRMGLEGNGLQVCGCSTVSLGDRMPLVVMIPPHAEYEGVISVVFGACVVGDVSRKLIVSCSLSSDGVDDRGWRVYKGLVNFNTIEGKAALESGNPCMLACEVEFRGDTGFGMWEVTSERFGLMYVFDIVSEESVSAGLRYASEDYVDAVMAADKAVAVEAARVAAEAKAVAMDQAGLSTTEAQKAIGAASEAKAAKVTAAGSASSASGSASAAETSEVNAVAASKLANEKASTATTKATEAASYSSTATAKATEAKASQIAANNSATVAATKANEAAASALGASNALNTLNGQKGQAYGVATLDATSRVPASQLPSYVDDVQEYSARANFPSTGETGKLYVAADSNKLYRWTGSSYIEVTSAPIIVTDNLNSSSPTDALSANQGRLLSNSKLDNTHNSSSTSHSDMRSQMASLVNASVPIGGTTGQVLVKHSDIDNDVRWDTPQSGGGGGLPSSLVSTTPNGDHYGNLVYKTYCAYNTSDESATNGPALFQIEMGPGSGGTQTACIAISSSLGFYGVYFNIGFEANSEHKLNPYDLDTGKIYLRRGYDTAFNYEDCLMASVDGDLMWRGKVISDSSSSGRLKAFHFGGGNGDYINLSKLVDVYYPGYVNSGATMTISIPSLSEVPAPENQQMNIYDFEVILCDGDIDSITQWQVSNPDTTDTKSTRLIWVGTSSPVAPPPFPAGYIHTIKGRFFRTSAFDYYRDNTVILQLVSSAKISS